MLVFFEILDALGHFLNEFLILLLVSLLRVIRAALVAIAFDRYHHSVLPLALILVSLGGLGFDRADAAAVFLGARRILTIINRC